MTKKQNLSVYDIENAVSSCGDEFTVFDAAKACGDVSAATRDRIYRLLDGDDRFFSEGETFIRRDSFFCGRVFLVTPDEWEIAEGILVPGHRFAPFVSPEVFPSECELKSNGTSFGRKTITAPLGKLFHYHLFLGSEQLFDFLIAENPANAHLRRSRAGGEAVTLDVYDLGAFYREHDFALGDALMCRISDFSAGKLEVSFVSGAARKEKERLQSACALDDAVVKVYDRFEEYLDIPEELAWGVFFARAAAPEKTISLDEYVRDSAKLAIRTDGGHAVLVPVESINQDAGNDAVPDFVSLSGGETSDIGAILRAIGSSYTPVETDAFMLDACYERRDDFEPLFREIFGGAAFADDAQKEIFRTMLEERFEEISSDYDRVADENKAPIRRDILDAVEERQEFFEFLAEAGKDPARIDRKTLEECAAITHRFDAALAHLGDPCCACDAAELETLASDVERDLEKFDRVMEKLNGLSEKE